MYPQQPQLQKGDNMFDYDSEKVVSYKETATMLTNFWRNRLMLRTQEFHEAMLRRDWDPTAVIKTNNGQQMTITAICEARKSGLIEARARLATAELMLEKATVSDESVAEMWTDAELKVPDEVVRGPIASPIQPEQK